jgi:YVTN family beta-propeller protein
VNRISIAVAGVALAALTVGSEYARAPARAAPAPAPAPAPVRSPVTAYVFDGPAGTVTPIRTATNTRLHTIKVGPEPIGIAITPASWRCRG